MNINSPRNQPETTDHWSTIVSNQKYQITINETLRGQQTIFPANTNAITKHNPDEHNLNAVLNPSVKRSYNTFTENWNYLCLPHGSRAAA